MNEIKFLFKLVFAVALAAVVGFFGYWGYKYYVCQGPNARLGGDYTEFLGKCAIEAKDYARVRNLNDRYCIFVDYSIPSGTPRVFVWSFEKEKVVYKTYTMHGPGMGSTAEKPVFSNLPGSKCSSLGHFAVTKVHGTRNKRGFRIKGLDIANKTAYARGLMIHRAKWVDTNCWREYIPLQPKCCLGCITVSSKGMNYLEKLIKGEEKQILLWSFTSESS
ncbi:MAG: murein L,D-transpeptidase catalytic domain family protein [Bacteroidales bacterium]|nr:murein L,D-transpeptidase catalytic domain family protein [Bacteroidales bacterium]